MFDSIPTYKNVFFYVPFGVDVLLCLVQWPLFAYNGPAWLLRSLCGDATHASGGYLQLYDLFMLCYTGYCGLMFFGLYAVLLHEGLLPAMAGLQIGIITMKMVLTNKLKGRGTNGELRAKKEWTLYCFYLPMYACYCALSYYVSDKT